MPDPEDRALTREDFADQEGWLRHCHEGGIDLTTMSEPGRFRGVSGPGHYGSLLAGIYGHDRRQYERAWGPKGVSDGVGLRQFKRAYRAVAFANCLGLTLNTKVDISWKTVGIQNHRDVANCLNQLLDALHTWFIRKGVPAAWLWVLEVGQTHGLHTHLFVHVPDALFLDFAGGDGFNKFVRERLEHIVKMPLLITPESRTVFIRHAEGRPVDWQWYRFRYMMKGIRVAGLDGRYAPPTRRFAARAGLTPRFQGLVTGRRVGFAPLLQDKSIDLWAAINRLPNMTVSGYRTVRYDARFLTWFDTHAVDLREPSMA